MPGTPAAVSTATLSRHPVRAGVPMGRSQVIARPAIWRRVPRRSGGGIRVRRVQRRSVIPATTAAIDRASGLTTVPATRTVGVASTPSAVARAVTYGAQSR